ncbi:DNA-binding protein [Paenibacillus larvae]|uniref:DNA-binding protein n=1 Tax=Paenibacillus larvae TaxID=1464 RepID=UPI002853F571|nr:DNA-binding protein [Paenibacillus larvae]MDR5585316.1 DNA-binding protein [Paenibacillus larvae]MDR5597935.1 DNA-binding protein [Paenibacillus larvae]
MDYRITLRGELEKAIDETGCTLSQLEEKGGTQIGNLSACLRGKTLRPITMKQLDKLTEVLGLPEGYYYEFYLAECFYKDRVARSRMESFLFRCVELGKTDLIMKAINILVEHPKYTELLFSVAEKLYLSGYAKENYKAVIRFESFRNKLPEGFQLDALLQLVNVCYTLEFWPMVEQFAEELRALSNIVYLEELRKLDNNRSEPPIETERHLVVYYGKSYLMKSLTLSKQGRYEEAKACIKGYEDLGWFKLLDDLGKKEVAKYSQFAKGNRYCIELLLGNTDMLDEFINFLTDHPTHTSGALLVILEAANTYRLNIDHILERFAEAYPQTSHQSGYLLIGILGFIIKKRFISLIGSCMKKGWKLFYIVFPCLFRPINIANH